MAEDSMPYNYLTMKSANKREPQLVSINGKPHAVILDIDDYKRLLEKAEDAEDLKSLAQMRKRPLKFTTLEEYTAGRSRRV